MRPRAHYLAIARAVVKTVVGYDGVQRGAKVRFQRKMSIVQNIFKLMYRQHEFRLAHALQTDMYTFIDRAKWTQRMSNMRKIVLGRCFLLTNYKPENYFDPDYGDLLISQLTRRLPFDMWILIYRFV